MREELIRKFQYARDLSFQFRVVVRGEVVVTVGSAVHYLVLPSLETFNPSLTEIVFVHNEAQAEGFPDNVIVAWPREGFVDRTLAAIQFVVDRTQEELDVSRFNTRATITLEQFGLSYPLTAEDLVDNWEKVYELTWSITQGEYVHIMNPPLLTEPPEQ